MNNQKGITLIEVLVTILILAIISSLIYGVFSGINKKYHKISGQNNLEQEANLILSTVKGYHLSNSSYQLTFNSTDKTYLIGTSSGTNVLGSSNLKSLTIDDEVIPNKPSNKTIDPTINPSINIHIELSNEHGEYVFETIIKRY